MRFVIALLAMLGMIISGLALRVHYSNNVESCDINSHWDCGVVSHSRYAEVGPIPVAAIGITGYLLLAILALLRRRVLTTVAASSGLAFALYLTQIEASRLEVWCLYCVISQGIIAFLTLLSLVWTFRPGPSATKSADSATIRC
jgi:vitamin-K-epoxide reductase (warfarin-sensitive)